MPLTTLPMLIVLVNGKEHTRLDAANADVDRSGRHGDVTMEARYEWNEEISSKRGWGSHW